VKIIRFVKDGAVGYGLLEGETVRRLTGSPFAGAAAPGTAVGRLRDVQLLAPCEPTKIICVAKNFPWGENPAKTARPVLFFKPPSTVIGPEEPIVHPAESERVIFEAELVVVIGKAARNVGVAEASRFILGYTCGNDVTAYDLVLRDGATFHGKSFDTFCPLGPCIVTDVDPEATTITCRVNGAVAAAGPSTLRYYNCAELVSFVSKIMTLLPGDIIMTGTPDIGDIRRGDVVEVDISGIGVLRNRVV
jgi:2-keto-4-pentenoate hydratase/2-oxohepta-3-ene-1,7-dioic acid hydratase in catechol pathway